MEKRGSRASFSPDETKFNPAWIGACHKGEKRMATEARTNTNTNTNVIISQQINRKKPIINSEGGLDYFMLAGRKMGDNWFSKTQLAFSTPNQAGEVFKMLKSKGVFRKGTLLPKAEKELEKYRVKHMLLEAKRHAAEEFRLKQERLAAEKAAQPAPGPRSIRRVA